MFDEINVSSIIFYIVSLVIAFALGYFRAILGIVRLALKEAEEININVTDVEDLKIEKVDGLYFAYAGADNQFLAQGKDFTDLISNIKSRFPERTFKLAKFDHDWSDEETQKFVTALKDFLQSKK